MTPNIIGLSDLLRAEPWRQDVREVIRDVLLESGDRRADLMVAEASGDPAAIDVAFNARWAAIQWRLGRFVTDVTLDGGFVTELGVPFERAGKLERAFFEEEPLATVRLVLGDKPPWDKDVESAGKVLSAARGISCDRRLRTVEEFEAFDHLIRTAQPRIVDVRLGVGITLAADFRFEWPSVEVLRFGAEGQPLAQFLGSFSGDDLGMPNLRALELDSLDENGLSTLLTLPFLRALDLRGATLSDKGADGLNRWLAGGEERSVRHEAFTLTAPPNVDQPPWIHGRSTASTTSTRCAVFSGKSLRYALVSGTRLMAYHGDRPKWTATLEASATALAATPSTILVGREDGVLESWSFTQKHKVIETFDAPVKSISVDGKAIAVLHGGGWWVRRGKTVSQGPEPLGAIALRGDDIVRGVGNVVEMGDQTRIDLGDPVRALAVSNDVVLAVAGPCLWELRDEQAPRLLSRTLEPGYASIAVAGTVRAWLDASTTVDMLRGGIAHSTTWPSRYNGGCDEPLIVADVAAHADGAVLAAFEHGGANLLLAGSALKLDEFPDEPRRKWVLVHDGSILMAG